jgi:MFS family permease
MDGSQRSIVTITMLSHAIVHVFELSIPVFIPIWIDQFGITAATIGVVVSAGYALFGLGALPGGILADQYGSSRLLLFCIAGMGLSFALLSVATSLAMVAVALLLWGVAASVYHPAGLSLISKGVDRRGTALGYHGIAGNVGIAFGPLATLLLLIVFPWRTVAALLAIPAALTIGVILFIGTDALDVSDDDERQAADPFSLADFLADSRRLFASAFALVFVLYILEGLYYRGTLTFLPDLLSTFSAFTPVTISGETVNPTEYVYAGLLLVGVVGQYASGKLSDRIRPEIGVVGVFVGLFLIGLAFIPAANAGLGPLLVVSSLLGVFLFGLQPFMQATVADHSPADVRGSSFGFVFAGLFGIGAAGAAITGVILTHAGARELFLAVAVFAAVAVGVGQVLRRWTGAGTGGGATTDGVADQ